MKNPEIIESEHSPDPHHDIYSKTTFGFWVYLMTDFVLFATLFATFVVLRKNTFGGPSAKDLFYLPFTFIQTLILLTSSFTSGLGGASAHRKHKKWTIVFFVITFFLGIAFLGMELAEFSRLIHGNNSWKRSAFLSAYFSIVGTHGIHMLFAILWIIVFLVPLWRQKDITSVDIRRLTCLRMFWQFLNIIWIFIFTIVYLIGGK